MVTHSAFPLLGLGLLHDLKRFALRALHADIVGHIRPAVRAALSGANARQSVFGRALPGGKLGRTRPAPARAKPQAPQCQATGGEADGATCRRRRAGPLRRVASTRTRHPGRLLRRSRARQPLLPAPGSPETTTAMPVSATWRPQRRLRGWLPRRATLTRKLLLLPTNSRPASRRPGPPTTRGGAGRAILLQTAARLPMRGRGLLRCQPPRPLARTRPRVSALPRRRPSPRGAPASLPRRRPRVAAVLPPLPAEPAKRRPPRRTCTPPPLRRCCRKPAPCRFPLTGTGGRARPWRRPASCTPPCVKRRAGAGSSSTTQRSRRTRRRWGISAPLPRRVCQTCRPREWSGFARALWAARTPPTPQGAAAGPWRGRGRGPRRAFRCRGRWETATSYRPWPWPSARGGLPRG
mmetsp:Transcript_7836/g.30947  ORF Transcript_7836/g.30947 Transcript_7836/m.30947 type:complete len:408 (-) Transcript_7836:2269-3492(-)